MNSRDRIGVHVTRCSLVWGAAALMAVVLVSEVISENFTMAASYPSPVGVYKRITATSETVLASKDGNVILAENGGGVAIGIKDPTAALDLAGSGSVEGNIAILKNTALEGNVTVEGILDAESLQLSDQGLCYEDGTLGYKDAQIRICVDGSWTPL